MTPRKAILFASLFAAVLSLCFAVYVRNTRIDRAATAPEPGPGPAITSFQECADAGYPVMESDPRQCRTPEGQLFVEESDTVRAHADLIRVSTPLPGETISSPLLIEGEARGTWFFEASFPVVLTDWDGRIIAQHYAEAQDDWMTEAFVPFRATLAFESPYREGDPEFMARGTLILQKDNPSGLPQFEDALEFSVRFSPGPARTVKNCIATGCSGQVCADGPVVTTCEFRDEYACYDEAVCEVQSDGECGWTETDDLTACLAAGGARN